MPLDPWPWKDTADEKWELQARRRSVGCTEWNPGPDYEQDKEKYE